MPSKRTLFSKPSAREAELAGDVVFRKWVNEKHGLQLADYWELHAWSVQNVSVDPLAVLALANLFVQLNRFWTSVWEYTGIIGEREG